MPLHNYKCDTCEEVVEKLLKFSEVTPTRPCENETKCTGIAHKVKFGKTSWKPGKSFFANGFSQA